ncbi:hypothetical protein NPIL_370201 [Nephila pilipes]|uniref:Uncharacterized protein n=1 Tax=Nephila pilipes TaxID=299642 RepID=A0A8X6QN88_NEPPI|nr:hypothetical protein NPIL_661111 [Nephila pilipes]GFS55765.1 hypothetical protein NPIL_606541 [Nephila pilipes]GFU09682.1 hypothetical protein NPIL_151261 [Nephila pilipes]GFU27958.1 hypothetical protein NPIL_370201 [Nephila pilipes]
MEKFISRRKSGALERKDNTDNLQKRRTLFRNILKVFIFQERTSKAASRGSPELGGPRGATKRTIREKKITPQGTSTTKATRRTRRTLLGELQKAREAMLQDGSGETIRRVKHMKQR